MSEIVEEIEADNLTAKNQEKLVRLRSREKGDYSAVVGPVKDDPEYSIRLTNASGNVSKEAKYLSSIAEDHPEAYESGNDLEVHEKFQAANNLHEKGILTDSREDIRDDIPEKFIEYAQAASISEAVEEYDFYKAIEGEKGNKTHGEDRTECEALEEFISSTNLEKNIWNSREICEESDKFGSSKEIGQKLYLLKEKYDVDDADYEERWQRSHVNYIQWDFEEIRKDLE